MDGCDFSGAQRRGSYDDAAVSLRPHFRNLAQRRRSAPSLVFGKTLGMSRSPIREESCLVSTDQSPFVLGLSSENGDLLMDENVQVTEGTKTAERHLFLFRDVIVIAKLKSAASYRLKHKVNLEKAWVFGFDPDLDDEAGLDPDLALTVVLAWDLTVCLLAFCSPEVKERWLDTLHRNITEAKARVGCESSPPDGLMKVLSGSVATKTLSGGGMEQLIELRIDGTANVTKQQQGLNQDERQSTENRWKGVVRRLRSGSSFVNRTNRTDAKKQLFGKSLTKICSEEGSLPKPILNILMLLRKRGPSTEGVFRRSCNKMKMMEVREQLNSGVEVDLDGQPVVLLVGLLKSFLKEVPDSLLDSDLYEKWMSAFDSEDVTRQAERLMRVIDQLPRPNILLLQHLFCVLFHIMENSDANKMDAHNLAVCIGPTLLQKEDAPLDEQPERIKKATDLTEFLLTHWEILGDNIPHLLDTDKDSVSSQHHDSAYDSTDPDGDLEHEHSVGEDHSENKNGSSSSLTTSPCWQNESAHLPQPLNRRCSEPIILLSPGLQGLHSHARSHDDCSLQARNFNEQPLKKQISDDSILIRNHLRSRNNMDALLLYNTANRVRDCSCSSIDSAASNQSEGSVFTSSPMGSPTCPRRPSQSISNIAQEKLEDKKRSQSMRVLLRAKSFNRISLKKADPQRENSFHCETLQEDSQNENGDISPKPRPLSAIDVFKYIDSRLPCAPPSYEQAIQNVELPPKYTSMTVQDAIQRRSRPSSVNYDLNYSTGHKMDAEMGHIVDRMMDRRQVFRPRAMSESVSNGRHEAVLRRCSQPVFEEFLYAKESYV